MDPTRNFTFGTPQTQTSPFVFQNAQQTTAGATQPTFGSSTVPTGVVQPFSFGTPTATVAPQAYVQPAFSTPSASTAQVGVAQPFGIAASTTGPQTG